ncbi:MAG: serine/threonine protein kinase [Planctomycetia bacterium]|nr:serine/threonine protein kinase [Planctomycetia bacterium]
MATTPVGLVNSSDVEERYVLDTIAIGTGGYGKVRQGEDKILQRKIAVKTLDPVWAAADDEDKERFKREARTLAKLNHPNIPAIYVVVYTDERFEIVFQFVEGSTLRSILTEGSVGVQECKTWFDQLASALQHAHERGIIHRDVKPENMIVSPDQKHCYLVDFGIALSQEEIQRLTGSDNWIGTPGYMAP